MGLFGFGNKHKEPSLPTNQAADAQPNGMGNGIPVEVIISGHNSGDHARMPKGHVMAGTVPAPTEATQPLPSADTPIEGVPQQGTPSLDAAPITIPGASDTPPPATTIPAPETPLGPPPATTPPTTPV